MVFIKLSAAFIVDRLSRHDGIHRLTRTSKPAENRKDRFFTGVIDDITDVTLH